MSTAHDDIAAMLDRVREGDDEARNHLVDLVYPELRRMARLLMSYEPLDHTFGLTGSTLVTELYIGRLGPETAREALAQAKDGKDVIRLLTRDMQQILKEHACHRREEARKRESQGITDPPYSPELYSVEMLDALEQLAKVFPDEAYAIELKYWFGLNVDEGAAAMNLEAGAFQRLIRHGTAWLLDYRKERRQP